MVVGGSGAPAFRALVLARRYCSKISRWEVGEIYGGDGRRRLGCLDDSDGGHVLVLVTSTG